MKAPKNYKEMQRVLGALGYYRRFIKDYAKYSSCLSRLTSKDVKYEWNSECNESFNILKNALISAPVLKLFNPDLEIVIITDASDLAVGAVLEQVYEDGRHPIEYLSKKLTSGQCKYPVHTKELFAIILSIRRWRVYLHNNKQFTIETDHHLLLYFNKQPKLSVVQKRWLDKLMEFNYIIKYKPGIQNKLADTLSRLNNIEINEVRSEVNIDPNMIENIIIGYHQDNDFSNVYNALLNTNKKVDKKIITKSKYFKIINRLLYYQDENNE